MLHTLLLVTLTGTPVAEVAPESAASAQDRLIEEAFGPVEYELVSLYLHSHLPPQHHLYLHKDYLLAGRKSSG